MKRLMRSQNDRKIMGVCGGLGEYFAVDPVIFRIVFVIFLFAGGSGLLIYLIMGFCMPKKDA